MLTSLIAPFYVEFIRHFRLLGRKQVCIVVSDVDALVTYPVRDGRGREPHVDQKRDRAMTNIVDSDARYPRFFGSPVHLPMEIAFGDGKHPVIRPDAVEHFDVILDFLGQKLRHGDDPIALFGFGGGNQILTVQPLIGLIDGDGALLKVKVCWGQGQQLPLSDTAPVEYLKGIEGHRLVHHHLGKFQVLLLGPEHHFPIFLFAHAACLLAGILPEVVVPNRVLEDGAELVMDRLEVHRRVGFTVLVLVIQHLVLPGDDLLGSNVAHLQPAEVGQQHGTDNMVLSGPGVFLEPGLHIRRVEVHEALKGHVQIGAGLIELFPLPCLCLPLGLEAPLLGLLAFAVPVGVAVDRPLGVGLFFLVDCHD